MSAQRLALKTNLVDWAILSPNLTLEAGLSSRLSLQVGLAANPLNTTIAGIRTKNFRVEPELRYWFNRPMARHFIALSATGGFYNLKFNSRNLVGDMVAGGISYGYALVLNDHWNFEAEIGVGIAHVSAKDYRDSEPAPSSKNLSRFVPVPIRCGLTFSYVFK